MTFSEIPENFDFVRAAGLLKEKGYAWREVADSINVSESTLYNLRSGSTLTFPKAARFFNYAANHLDDSEMRLCFGDLRFDKFYTSEVDVALMLAHMTNEGISCKDVAKDTGISVRSVERYISGHKPRDNATVSKILKMGMRVLSREKLGYCVKFDTNRLII